MNQVVETETIRSGFQMMYSKLESESLAHLQPLIWTNDSMLLFLKLEPGVHDRAHLGIFAQLLCAGALATGLGGKGLEVLLIRHNNSHQEVLIAVTVDPDLLHQLTLTADN